MDVEPGWHWVQGLGVNQNHGPGLSKLGSRGSWHGLPARRFSYFLFTLHALTDCAGPAKAPACLLAYSVLRKINQKVK